MLVIAGSVTEAKSMMPRLFRLLLPPGVWFCSELRTSARYDVYFFHAGLRFRLIRVFHRVEVREREHLAAGALFE